MVIRYEEPFLILQWWVKKVKCTPTCPDVFFQIVPKMIDSGTLLLTSSTGKGEILQKFYFNNEFCIIVSTLTIND